MAREDIDLYKIGSSPEELQSALQQLRADFDAHIHDGVSSRAFQTMSAETVSARAILVKKTSYNDTAPGIWMGLVGSAMKLKLGSASAYLDWDGIALNITGSISGSTITGGTIQTASGTGQRIVMASSDNTITFYNSSNAVVTQLGGGASIAVALRINLDASTTTGVRVTSANASDVGFLYQSTGNYAQTGFAAQLTGATNSGTGLRIDHDGNGGEGIFIQGTGAAKGVYLEMSGTGQGLYITHSSTGLGLEIIKSGAGIVASFESSNSNLSSSVVYMTSNSTDSGAATLHVNRSTSHTIIKATQSINTSDRLYGLHLNLANAGSGAECAFRFEGSEYDSTPTGVSGFVGVVKVFPDAEGNVCYIPVYSTAT